MNNKIKIKEEEFYYTEDFGYTIFYSDLKTQYHKKYFNLFGPIIAIDEPINEKFIVRFKITDVSLTRDYVKRKLEDAYDEYISRKKQIEQRKNELLRGEIN